MNSRPSGDWTATTRLSPAGSWKLTVLNETSTDSMVTVVEMFWAIPAAGISPGLALATATSLVELFARYRHEIPVLMWGTVEIARGRVDARDLLDRLKAITSR